MGLRVIASVERDALANYLIHGDSLSTRRAIVRADVYAFSNTLIVSYAGLALSTADGGAGLIVLENAPIEVTAEDFAGPLTPHYVNLVDTAGQARHRVSVDSITLSDVTINSGQVVSLLDLRILV